MLEIGVKETSTWEREREKERENKYYIDYR